MLLLVFFFFLYKYCFCIVCPKGHVPKGKQVLENNKLVWVRVQKIACCLADWFQFVKQAGEKG